MRENTGEEFKMAGDALAIEMRETPRDAGDLVRLV